MSESVACVVPPNRIAHLRLLERTKERRAALVMKLGGRCIHCGATENLEFDHHSGRNWTIRDKSRWTRMSIYEREAARGRLRLLCRSCNASYRAKKSKDDKDIEALRKALKKAAGEEEKKDEPKKEDKGGGEAH